MSKLTAKQQRFVDEYLIDLNATQAYIRAGYAVKNEDTAAAASSNLLRNIKVKEAIQEKQSRRSERTKITQDMVLERLWSIATANPNEIMQVRHKNCRKCYGIDHKWQWKDEEEFKQALQESIALEKSMQMENPDFQCEHPNNEGGYGFNPIRPPFQDCPKCFGEGVIDVHFKDTRNLSKSAQMLYAGVKQTKDGLEVKVHDQINALIQVARHLGMFKDKIEHSGTIDIKSISDEELESRIRALSSEVLGNNQ